MGCDALVSGMRCVGFWDAMRSAVGNSPPYWNESPFQTFVPKFQPEFVVDSFDEFSEMEIRSKKGASCRRLDALVFWDVLVFLGCYDLL